MVALQTAPNRSQWSAVNPRRRRERASVSWVTLLLHGGQWLVANPRHHRLEIIPHLLREPQPFDDRSRTEQRQDPNIIQRKLAVHRRRAFDQPIKCFQFRHQGVDLLAGLGAKLDEVSKLLAFAHDVVIERRDRAELRQTKTDSGATLAGRSYRQ